MVLEPESEKEILFTDSGDGIGDDVAGDVQPAECIQYVQSASL